MGGINQLSFLCFGGPKGTVQQSINQRNWLNWFVAVPLVIEWRNQLSSAALWVGYGRWHRQWLRQEELTRRERVDGIMKSKTKASSAVNLSFLELIGMMNEWSEWRKTINGEWKRRQAAHQAVSNGAASQEQLQSIPLHEGNWWNCLRSCLWPPIKFIYLLVMAAALYRAPFHSRKVNFSFIAAACSSCLWIERRLAAAWVCLPFIKEIKGEWKREIVWVCWGRKQITPQATPRN